MNSHDMNSLIKNVHQNIIEEIQSGDCYLTKFDYDFYHYRCDSTDDVVSFNYFYLAGHNNYY